MRQRFYIILAALILSVVEAQATIVYTNLGTSAPPAVLSGYAMTPFDEAQQAAIANGTDVTVIPGSPIPGDLTTSETVEKRTIGAGWATWSHGYTGPVFVTTSNSVTLNLPANTGAFYFYAEPNTFALRTITAVTLSGVSSGPVDVNGSSDATGFAFYSDATDPLVAITITTNDSNMAIAEFGIASVRTATVPMSDSAKGLLVLIFGVSGFYMLRRRRLA